MKKIIKNLFILAIILYISIPVFGLANKNHGENHVLVGMLKELKGDFLEGDVNMGGVILDEFLSKKDIESMGKEIKSKMGIIGEVLDPNIKDEEYKDYSEEFIYEDNFNQLAIYGYDAENNPITVIIASYVDSVSNLEETTLFINLIKRGKNFDINGIMDKMENIFKKFNKPIETTTCVIGTLKGKMGNDMIEKRLLKSMEKFKLKVIEKYTDTNVMSYTGYTPLIDSSIFSGKKEVNFNLAIRYNEYEDKTYIWIGTPIITTGY